ncbi:MAG: cupin domain-containing protein [Opitutales bacterium]|nr:cupin domain-containing protein [Opitutales bacterium]
MKPSPIDQIRPEDLAVAFGLTDVRLGDRPVVRRHLADLRGCFADEAAFSGALATGNPLLYEVCAVEAAEGDGQLHYGLGILYPGKVGSEYYLTKGHLHAHRPASEVYIGLAGEGAMLLEDEATGASRLVPLGKGRIVYVPGHTAHRTVNTGAEPLVYIGVYPANAGHDYASIAERNFHKVVLERAGVPALVDRDSL